MSVVFSLLSIGLQLHEREIIEHRISTCNLEFYSILSAMLVWSRYRILFSYSLNTPQMQWLIRTHRILL